MKLMLDFFNSHVQGLADVHPTWMPWTCLGCVSNCVSLLSTIVIQVLSLILFIFRVVIVFVRNGSNHVLRFQKSSVHICSTGTSVLPKRRVKLIDYDYLNVISSAEKTSKSKLKPNIVELLSI